MAQTYKFFYFDIIKIIFFAVIELIVHETTPIEQYPLTKHAAGIYNKSDAQVYILTCGLNNTTEVKSLEREQFLQPFYDECTGSFYVYS